MALEELPEIVKSIRRQSERWPQYDGHDTMKLIELREVINAVCDSYDVPYLPELKSLEEEDLQAAAIMEKHGPGPKDNVKKLKEINSVIIVALSTCLTGTARLVLSGLRKEVKSGHGRGMILHDWIDRTDIDLEALESVFAQAEADLVTTKLQSQHDLSNYRRKIDLTVSTLRMSSRFVEEDTVKKLVSNLPTQARVYVEDKMETMDDSKKKMVTFWTILKRAVMCMPDVPMEREEAYYAQGGRGRGGRQRYAGQGNYGRGRGKHGVRRGGSNRKHEPEGKDLHRFNGNCHYCKGYGHKKADCEAWRTAKHKEHGPKGGNSSKNSHDQAHAYTSVLQGPEEANFHLRADQGMAIVDSGASSHFLNDERLFETMMIHKVPIESGGTTVLSQGVGTARMFVDGVDGSRVQVVLRDALYVPSFKRNLVSTRQLGEAGTDVKMPDYKTIVMKQGDAVWKAECNRNGLALYSFTYTLVPNMAFDAMVEMHRRLGHPPADAMRAMLRNEDLDTQQLSGKIADCEQCHLFKAKMATIPKKAHPRTPRRPGDLIVSDMFGPISTPSLYGDKYIIAYKDVATGYLFLDPVKSKDELTSSFERLLRDSPIPIRIKEADVARQSIFQSDNDGAYCSTRFRTKLKELGISWRASPPRTPQMNGAIENAFREIRDMVGLLLADSKLPQGYWGFAAKHAEYLINIKVKSVYNNMSAYQLLHGKNPHALLDLHSFGADAYVCDKDHRRSKFGPKARKGVYVGFSPAKLAHKVYMLDTRRMIETVHLKLCPHARDEGENVDLPSLASMQTWKHDEDDSQDVGPQEDDEDTSTETEDVPEADDQETDTPFASPNSSPAMSDDETMVAPLVNAEVGSPAAPLASTSGNSPGIGGRVAQRRSASGGRNKAIQPSLNVNELASNAGQAQANPSFQSHRAEVCYNTTGMPQTVAEALARPDAAAWQRALDDEIASFQEHQVMTGLDQKPNAALLDLRVVFDIKQDGRYKARIVAKGFKQREGINYDETYSPTVNMTTVRTLMALATYQHYHVHQVDVKTAFLHAPLDEDIYIRVPRGLEAGLGGCEYAKLNKAVYGLKQASRAWYLELDKYLRDIMQCRRLRQDECVYVYKEDTDIVWALAYVDDILLVGSTERIINNFKRKLKGKFETKDFGQIKNFLNMEFTISQDSITIKQTAFIESILKEFNMDSCKPMTTPWTTGVKLERVTKTEGDFPYRQLMGKLNYLATHTRPDIAATVSLLSAHNQCFDETHWQAAKRLLRYLKGTKDLGIRFEDTQELQLAVYTDASFAQEHDKKSREGCAIFLCNGPLYWRSKRQTTTATSTAEAEYMAAHSGAAKGVVLRELINELLILPELKPLVYCDNQPAIANVINGNAQRGQHHTLIKFYALREMYERNQVDIVYCPTDDMTADVLTKPLPRDAHERHMRKLCFSA